VIAAHDACALRIASTLQPVIRSSGDDQIPIAGSGLNYSDPFGLNPCLIPPVAVACGEAIIAAGAATTAFVSSPQFKKLLRDTGRLLSDAVDKVTDAIKGLEGSGTVQDGRRLRHVDRTGEGSSAGDALREFGDAVGRPVEPTAHPDVTQVRIPGGGTASARPSSRTGPPTVQVNQPGRPPTKIRFDNP
jgi:hypothetical protein